MKQLKQFYSCVTALMLLLPTAAFGHQTLKADPGARYFQDGANESVNEAAVVEILEKHIAAIGGREKWKTIRTVETKSEAEIFGSLNKSYRLEDRTTGRFYQVSESANGRTESGFDGKRVWRKTPFFRGYLPDADPQTKAALNKRPPLYEYRESKRKFERLPNEAIDGKEHLVLKSTEADPVGRESQIKYYFDPTTYLIKQVTTGSEITQTSVSDDYRKIDGRTIAFSTLTTNPQITIKSRIVNIAYDVPADTAKFEFRDDSAAPSAPAASPTTPATAPGSNDTNILSEAARIETLDVVWKTINDSYWDRTFGGVDWQAVRAKYLPLAKQTERSDEYHRLLDQMVGELRRSHFKVTAPADTGGLHSRAGDLKNGSVGLDLRWIDSQLLVVGIRQDSPAHAAGIRKGFVINTVDGKNPDEIFADYKRKHQGFQLRHEIARVRAVGAALAGQPGTNVKLEVTDNKNDRLPFQLTRKARSPAESFEFEHKRLAANIGYIRFNIFFGDLLSKFEAAISELRDTQALIIDLRGNPGGIGQLTSAIANSLDAKAGSLGSFKFRYETQPLGYRGTGDRAYKGRVVLLVDEMSASSSEVFAGGLQEQGRAAVIGVLTTGAVLPSLAQLLPTGGGLQYVVSNFQTPRGIALEGKGIVPDVEAKHTRASLSAGRDVALEKALDFLKPRA